MTMTSPTTVPPRPRQRRDLSDRLLIGLALAALGLCATFLLARPWLPSMLQRPGTPVLQSAAIVGSLLLLVPFAYVLAKRGGGAAIPNHWLIAHVVASLAGLTLVVAHSGGALATPPSTMLYALAALVATGVVARTRISRSMASTLGRKTAAFAAPDPALRTKLAAIIARKTTLLTRLDPNSAEATFSVGLRHWRRHPFLAWRYQRLAAREAGLMGTRASVGFLQAWWRPLHLALAVVFLGALVLHVATVTFFAGYVAGGRPITWWHVTAW